MHSPSEERINLRDYAEDSKCFVCNSPYRTQIEDGWKEGIRATTIYNWLVDIVGIDSELMTVGKIRNHFVSKHS